MQTTDEVSIEVNSAPVGGIKSPSPRKRKRFAGVWNSDDLNLDAQNDDNDAHVLKRARVEVGRLREAGSEKENISSESD